MRRTWCPLMNGQRAMKRVRWHTYKCTRLAHIVGSVGEVSGIGSGMRHHRWWEVWRERRRRDNRDAMREEARQESQRHNKRGKDTTTSRSNGRGNATREAARWERQWAQRETRWGNRRDNRIEASWLEKSWRGREKRREQKIQPGRPWFEIVHKRRLMKTFAAIEFKKNG